MLVKKHRQYHELSARCMKAAKENNVKNEWEILSTFIFFKAANRLLLNVVTGILLKSL